MEKYFISTYGCQMNVHESEKIAGMLKECGYTQALADEKYDIIIFNTCCIRDTAEKKILGHIGRIKAIKAKNKNLIVAVVGCMTQQADVAEKLKEKFGFIDIILGTNNIHDLPHYIQIAKNKKKIIKVENCDKPPIVEFDSSHRTSYPNAWVNIMYGCNNFCSYCIVPHVRGRERSRKPQDIIDEVAKLLGEGYKEITLLGQNVDSYGSDLEGVNFAYLLKELANFDGEYRIRFMTSHPKDLSEEVVNVIKSNKNICNYIHLPLQAGSNKILNLMNRHYDREQYLKLIEMIRNNIPNCGITTDIMVGFPYEEEDDFNDTLDMVKLCNFSGAFTYVFSPRSGTKAFSMEQIPEEIKKERIQKLIKTQNEITKIQSRNYEGNIYRILCEDGVEGEMLGRTDCGRLVKFCGNKDMIGSFFNVKILKSRSASLYGEVYNG